MFPLHAAKVIDRAAFVISGPMSLGRSGRELRVSGRTLAVAVTNTAGVTTTASGLEVR